jgi:hypothetical protein
MSLARSERKMNRDSGPIVAEDGSGGAGPQAAVAIR